MKIRALKIQRPVKNKKKIINSNIWYLKAIFSKKLGFPENSKNSQKFMTFFKSN